MLSAQDHVALASRRNLVPGAYRGVAVTTVPDELTPDFLQQHFLGREAYRRTRFIVVRGPRDSVCVISVSRDDAGPLFAPITAVEIIGDATECAWIVDPEVDTAVPTQLADAARRLAPRAKVVVVEGRYAHVNIIANPDPLIIKVQEVVPPYPAKLADQAARILAIAEDLPPMRLDVAAVDFVDLAAQVPADRYLLPCRGAGVKVDGAAAEYLDERPAREEWVLLGCERSRQIHEWFYGDSPTMVSMCPREREVAGLTLAKCCLLEDEIVVETDRVIVPWGASLAQVAQGLREVARLGDPSWVPA